MWRIGRWLDKDTRIKEKYKSGLNAVWTRSLYIGGLVGNWEKKYPAGRKFPLVAIPALPPTQIHSVLNILGLASSPWAFASINIRSCSYIIFLKINFSRGCMPRDFPPKRGLNIDFDLCLESIHMKSQMMCACRPGNSPPLMARC